MNLVANFVLSFDSRSPVSSRRSETDLIVLMSRQIFICCRWRWQRSPRSLKRAACRRRQVGTAPAQIARLLAEWTLAFCPLRTIAAALTAHWAFCSLGQPTAPLASATFSRVRVSRWLQLCRTLRACPRADRRQQEGTCDARHRRPRRVIGGCKIFVFKYQQQ